MNDRFKFRAKLKNIDNWVYGAYLKMLPYQPNPVGHRKPLETEYKHLIITEGSADWGMPREIAAYEVIFETVGQCTGLKDKNGKLIYEGDVVNQIYEDETIYKCEVVYNNCSFQLKHIEDKNKNYINTPMYCYAINYLGHYTEKRLEVIGNIYEDKELLEDTKQN